VLWEEKTKQRAELNNGQTQSPVSHSKTCTHVDPLLLHELLHCILVLWCGGGWEGLQKGALIFNVPKQDATTISHQPTSTASNPTQPKPNQTTPNRPPTFFTSDRSPATFHDMTDSAGALQRAGRIADV